LSINKGRERRAREIFRAGERNRGAERKREREYTLSFTKRRKKEKIGAPEKKRGRKKP